MAEGNQQQQVDPAAARAFVTNYAHDPKVLEGMPDDQVMAWHGNVSTQIKTAQDEALKNYDWRSPILTAKPDAKATLERMASPVNLYEGYEQFRTKLSKGEMRLVQPYPEKGTDEQKSEWRQQNGVPADGKYELKLDDGIVVGEDHKPVIDAYLKHAFEQNIPTAEANKSVNWFMKETVAREQRAREEFETQKRDTAALLGAEWGSDYKGNLNRISGVLDATIPSGEEGDALRGLINNAISTNPLFARHYAQIAVQLNPHGSFLPGGTGANEAGLVDQLKAIDKTMATNRGAYDKDKDMQNRYGQLLTDYARIMGKDWDPRQQ